MLELRAIAGRTGRLLEKMLDERGLLEGRVKGIVHYGYSPEISHLPTLNAKAGRQNKYKELVALDNAGVRTIPFSKSAGHLRTPMLGRSFQHDNGDDIVIYQDHDVDHHDFYSQLISKEKEYRVWVFRNKALAVYEKILEYHGRGKDAALGKWTGNEFIPLGVAAPALKEIAVKAVGALNLDFGAIDILFYHEKYYVLEVNTAPGFEGRWSGITSLVDCIEKWAKNGFPEA